ncbi:MAG: hypothetical protein P8M80_16290 [Pirellulaceae bacterium]|nr:hypothetical protein [Pirellulaceae bacterium]
MVIDFEVDQPAITAHGKPISRKLLLAVRTRIVGDNLHEEFRAKDEDLTSNWFEKLKNRDNAKIHVAEDTGSNTAFIVFFEEIC